MSVERLEGITEAIWKLELGTLPAILVAISQVFNELSLPYWLAWGTCLGVVRDGKLVPWDKGGDIGCFGEFDGSARQALARLFGNRGFLAVWAFDAKDDSWGSLTVATITSAEIYLRLKSVRAFASRFTANCDGVSISFYRQAEYIGMENIGGITRFPSHLFHNRKEVEFLESKFYVPNPPEEYLRLCYGRDWRTPKQSGWEHDWKENP